MESPGRQLHGKATQARESGDFLEALKLNDEALLAYQESGDILGFAENLVDRSITYRLLHDQTGDANFSIIAEHESLAAVEIAKKSGFREALAVPLFKLANVQEKLGKFPEAVSSYKDSVENMVDNPPKEHDRPAVLADMKVHLATTEYKAGDKSALERAEDALKELKEAEEPSDYNKHVWVSGGHMRIAEILGEENPEKAKEHLQKAKEIIDSDPRLTLRLSQWQKLAEKFNL